MSGHHKLALTVDVEEWYHSGRWVEGEHGGGLARRSSRAAGAETGNGVVALTRTLLDMFDRRGIRGTFFVLGEVAARRPDLVVEIAARGHEVACHGQRHADMTALGPARFESELEESADRLRAITGRRPCGYRAPNLIYEPWATRILESHGFRYDSSVCRSRPVGGKYRGWAKAPSHPYRPSYEDVAAMGGARLVELPLPAFPFLRLAAGSGITTRILGLHWTLTALRSAMRVGHTIYYLHPWEIGSAPARQGPLLKRTLFHRHMGAWMVRAVDRIIDAFPGRFITAEETALQCTAPEWAYGLSPAMTGTAAPSAAAGA